MNPFRGVNLRDWGSYLIGFGKEERELCLIKTIKKLDIDSLRMYYELIDKQDALKTD